jgi:hypothetical protein
MNKKKQHFVPQGYLRRFADERQHLHVFDKVQRIAHKANVKDVAQKSRFYDIPEEVWAAPIPPDYDPQFVENFFSGIESGFNDAIDELINTVELRGIGPSLRETLAMNLALQDMRTLGFRSQLIELYNKGMQKIADDYVEAGFGPDVGKPSVSLNPAFHSVQHSNSCLTSAPWQLARQF